MTGQFSTMPVRFNHLRAYGRSAAHGLHARTEEASQTYAMQRGTAVHAILFGTRKVIGYPGAVRRGKEWEAFAADRPDHEILTMAEYDKANRMADAVRQCDAAQPWLNGVFEETLRFKWNGLDCRATPDVRGPDYLTELKTSATADPVRFGWHALRMHYHAQMWFQNIACEEKIRRHMIVCVESAAPYPVTVFEFTPRALDVGARLLMLWAERLKQSEQSRQWPPYSTAIVPIDVDDEPEIDFGDETDAAEQRDLTMAG